MARQSARLLFLFFPPRTPRLRPCRRRHPISLLFLTSPPPERTTGRARGREDGGAGALALGLAVAGAAPPPPSMLLSQIRARGGGGRPDLWGGARGGGDPGTHVSLAAVQGPAARRRCRRPPLGCECRGSPPPQAHGTSHQVQGRPLDGVRRPRIPPQRRGGSDAAPGTDPQRRLAALLSPAPPGPLTPLPVHTPPCAAAWPSCRCAADPPWLSSSGRVGGSHPMVSTSAGLPSMPPPLQVPSNSGTCDPPTARSGQRRRRRWTCKSPGERSHGGRHGAPARALLHLRLGRCQPFLLEVHGVRDPIVARECCRTSTQPWAAAPP
ncbi:hypothetical protein C2845_PM03G32500 [Panicum miliaceum]|uniref:Uncharacterized protein n=1 Tax=Panicum miliaceum TaxID=4540 RepID=A0A3L6THB2_PANMI|nr:hypothetical protein C2845_PM03G32500 [Panicum miliaceum]